MSFDSRLRLLEGQGNRCPECGLAPQDRRKMAVIYDDPDKGFEGDPYEVCAACGEPLYCVIRVVYDGEGGGGVRWP